MKNISTLKNEIKESVYMMVNHPNDEELAKDVISEIMKDIKKYLKQTQMNAHIRPIAAPGRKINTNVSIYIPYKISNVTERLIRKPCIIGNHIKNLNK